MKFGVREICDVTFKATANNQKVGTKEFKKYQPVFTIDTAQTSNMEQASTTVYAQGGKGYNRLIAWEGEKTMTFTVTDALISPMGLAVLSGAGLVDLKKKAVHVHATIDANADTDGIVTVDFDTLAEEIGVSADATIAVCTDADAYGTILDGSGYGYAWLDSALTISGSESAVVDADNEVIKIKKGDSVKFTPANDTDKATAKGKTVKVDFYVVMTSGASEIEIKPNDFGGYFYVEADTLFRREDNGIDMAATLTFPRVKVQSGFTFTMAASGDPSTFDFTMDAFPGYTQFDSTKKVCVTMAIVGDDTQGVDDSGNHSDHGVKGN